jgi:pyridoxamine 5'-phosphate oxidase
MVLLRGLDHGLVFFTDYESDKAADLESNPRAAAVLNWLVPAHRQVRAVGPVERVSEAESDRYWLTRPPGSRRSAAASHQSRVIPSRAALEAQVAAIAERYPDDADVPRPARWGGYRITPERVELWEQQPDRLHDRLRYRREGDGWTIERLSP